MNKEEKDNFKVYKNTTLIKDLWFYIKPYKGKFFLATFCRALGDIAWLYPSYAIASVVEFFSTYQSGNSLRPIFIILFIYLATVIIRVSGSYLSRIYGYNLAARSNRDSILHVMKHLFLLDMSWHEKENSGNKMKRIDKGSAGIEKIIRIWITNFIEIGIGFVGVIFIISKFDLPIAGALAFFIVTFYWISSFFRKRGVAASRLVNIQDEKVNGILFESINNIRTVKVMSMSDGILSRLLVETDDLLRKVKTRIFWFQGGMTTFLYAQIFFVSVSVYIVFGITQNFYTISFLVLFNLYFGRVWGAIQEFTEMSDQYAIAKNDFHRMQMLLTETPTIDIEKNKINIPVAWKKITIENLSFSYDDKKILDNISFEILRGQKVGIIGLSGAGKSTLFKLLLKENESYTGQILFDGVSLKDIGKIDYLKHTAVVLQETELFNSSLRENIATNQQANKQYILLKKAIEVAHVKDFMAKLPEGVETVVGEKGVKLSGGEKQRVGIARAVFKEPELLLMDEATSHLDIESEKKIQESLHEFFKEVTAVVVAHRLTTIKEMNKIIVIEEGRIVEEGDFKDLQKKKGRFFELWEKQKL